MSAACGREDSRYRSDCMCIGSGPIVSHLPGKPATRPPDLSPGERRQMARLIPPPRLPTAHTGSLQLPLSALVLLQPTSTGGEHLSLTCHVSWHRSRPPPPQQQQGQNHACHSVDFFKKNLLLRFLRHQRNFPSFIL